MKSFKNMSTKSKIITGAAAAIIAIGAFGSCGGGSDTQTTTPADTMAQAQQAYDQQAAQRQAEAEGTAQREAAEKQAKIDAARATGITPETHSRIETHKIQKGANERWYCYQNQATGEFDACYGDNQPGDYTQDPWNGIWTGTRTPREINAK